MNYKRHRLFVWGLSTIMLLIIFKVSIFWPLVLYIRGLKEEIVLRREITHIYVSCFRFCFITQFILACSAVRVRFESLNDHVNSFKLHKKFKIVSTKSLVSVEFRQSYFQLCDAIDIINDTFTLHLAFIFAIFLVSRIISANRIKK